MNTRIAALSGALLLVLAACPGDPDPQPDGGDADGGFIIPPPGGCTGGCGPHQICDEDARRCVSACQPECGPEEICIEQGGAHVCEQKVTACGGNTCGAGQAACVDDTCSCLSYQEAAVDTCHAQGRLCGQAYNPVTMTGGSCEAPSLFEACNPDCTGPDCAICENGGVCGEALFEFATCWRSCGISGEGCHPEELCARLDDVTVACLPKNVFSTAAAPAGVIRPGRQCAIVDGQKPNGDYTFTRTAASDPCLVTNAEGDLVDADPLVPTGTCSWLIVQGPSSREVLTYCRAPGPVAEGGACTVKGLSGDINTTCGTGLECVPQGHDGQGICVPVCNARPTASGGPGFPGCEDGETCVNVHRMDDPAKVPGACMQTCDVFSTTASAQNNYGCQDVGGVATSCVPTGAKGDVRVTADGSGVCLPRLPSVAAVGQPCAETDAFRGAACDTGLVCARGETEATATCKRPCDLECASTTPPARCAMQANATCGGGQTCTQVTGTTGARLGFCQ